MLSLIVFIIVLSLLIFVHELGHFLMAKRFKIRVDEFAIGFPPKIWSFIKNGTKFAINIIPLGGYVKIHGQSAENKDEMAILEKDKDSFISKTKWQRSLVLLAGIAFNVIFAWILISLSFFIGGEKPVPFGQTIPENATYKIVALKKESPADKSGLELGMEVKNIFLIDYTTQDLIKQKIENPRSENISQIVNSGSNPEETKLVLEVQYKDYIKEVPVSVEYDSFANKYQIGVSIEPLVFDRESFLKSLYLGLGQTFYFTVSIWQDLGHFISGFFNGGDSSVKMLTGPVGLANHLGQASKTGFDYLLIFTAFISLNLAVLNLFPIPALDGGQLFFIIIEGIIGKKISPRIANIISMVGFGLLILLMLSVSFFDIKNLFIR